MKKLIFILLFLISAMTMSAQYNFMTIDGIVTDLVNSSPVPNHAVTIQVDSASGFSYYNVVYTNSSGFYLDTIFFPGSVPTGVLTVSTMDCQQAYQYGTFNFGPGNQAFVKDFQICTSNSNCNADFSWQSNYGTLTVQFTNLSSGSGPLTYSWQFGDGSVSTQQNPQHTYAQAGYYNVTLSISDSSINCSDAITKTILAGDSTGGCHAAYTYSADTNQQLIHFTDQSTGNNIVSWLWNFGDPASGSSNTSSVQNPFHFFTAPGIYSVCLTIHGSDSSCYDTYCGNVTVGNSGGCQAQFTWYSDSAGTSPVVQFIDLSIGNISTWYWYFGDNTYSTQQNPVHSYAQAGTYHVCLTITGQDSTCSSTWCADVTTGNGGGCTSYFTFSQNSLTVSFEGHMVYNQPATYTWSFGDGTGGTGQNATHTYGSAGMYYVTLTTSTDSLNCTYSSGQTIQVGDSSQFNQIYGQVFEARSL